VPCPVDPCTAQNVTDIGPVQWRQLYPGSMRLVSGLNRIDCVVPARETRYRGRADHRKLRIPYGSGRLIKLVIDRHAVRIHYRVDRSRCTGPSGRCCRYQPLVIKKGAAKCRLEKVVRDGVVRMSLAMQVGVDRQGARVVKAHTQADGVAARYVAILLAPVELILLLIEAVHEIARTAARKIIRVWQETKRW